MMCDFVFKESKSMGVEIPMPITFMDFVKGKFDSTKVERFYFDELQISLSNMANRVPIDTVIIGANEESNLYAVGNSVNRKEKMND